MSCLYNIAAWISILTCLCFRFTNAAHPFEFNDNMGRQDKTKMFKLASELVKDAKIKQRQVHAIRGSHNIHLSYEVGMVIGKIREKYKRMMEAYKQGYFMKFKKPVSSHSWWLFWTEYVYDTPMPPGIREVKPIHWIVSMELIHSLEVDIDKLVHVLESIPKKEYGIEDKFSPLRSGKESLRQGPAAPVAQTTTDSAATATESPDITTDAKPSGVSQKPTFHSEDELKQHYRDRYTAQKGHNTSWTLDEYYGFN